MSTSFTDNAVTEFVEKKLTCSRGKNPICSAKGTHEDYPINTPIINEKYNNAIRFHKFDMFLNAQDDYNFLDPRRKEYSISKLGGGASGAYVFKCEPLKGESKESILKIYFTALEMVDDDGENSAYMIRDDRPFREARSLELLSRYMQEHPSLAPGMFTSLLDVPQILPFEKLQSLFYTEKLKIFEPQEGSIAKAKNETQNDARNYNEKAFFPTHVLAVHMQKAGPSENATELMNIDVKDTMYGGAIAQLIVVYFDHFQKVFPKGCHWDLHVDNIFVDKSCIVRSSVPLDHLYKRSDEDNGDGPSLFYDNREMGEEERDLLSGKLRDLARASSDRYLLNLPFGLPFEPRPSYIDSPSRLAASGSGTRAQDATAAQWLKKLTEPVPANLVEIAYPAVTIIDFDFVTFDTETMRTPTTEHMKKLALPGGISERTITWLLKHLPRSSVWTMTEYLRVLYPSLPKYNAGDWCHLLSYVFAFSVYSISSVWGKACDFATDEFLQKVAAVKKWDKKTLFNLFIPTDSGTGIYSSVQVFSNASQVSETLQNVVFATKHEALDKKYRDLFSYFELITGIPFETFASFIVEGLNGLFGVNVEVVKIRDVISKFLLLPDFTSYEDLRFRIGVDTSFEKEIGTSDEIKRLLEDWEKPPVSPAFLDYAVGLQVVCNVNLKYIDFKLKNKKGILIVENQNGKDLIMFRIGNNFANVSIKKMEIHIGATIEVFIQVGQITGGVLAKLSRSVVTLFTKSDKIPKIQEGAVVSYVLEDNNEPNPVTGVINGSPESILEMTSILKGDCFGEWTKYLTPAMKELAEEIILAVYNSEIAMLPVSTTSLFKKITLVKPGPVSGMIERVSKPGIGELFGYLNFVRFKMSEVLPVVYILGKKQKRGTSIADLRKKAQNIKDILELYAKKNFRSEKWGAYMSLEKAETEIVYIANKFFSMSEEKLSEAIGKNLQKNYSQCVAIFSAKRNF